MQDRDVTVQIWGITYSQIWGKKGDYAEFEKFSNKYCTALWICCRVRSASQLLSSAASLANKFFSDNIRTLSPVQTNATLFANNSQHCWRLHVASVCTPCCMLLGFVALSLKPVKLLATWKRTQQLPTMLRPFARSFSGAKLIDSQINLCLLATMEKRDKAL